MKNLGKLKLNQLSKVEMQKKEMYNLVGGHCGSDHSYCGCACAYAQSGGSSNDANGDANSVTGIQSSATYG